jgi:hypothetical protein
MDWPTIIGVLALLIPAGGLMFYQQKKSGMEIANAAALASEWEKLYREQKTVREQKDSEVEGIRAEMVEVKAEVASIRPYICYDLACQKRITRNQQKIQDNEEK